MNVENSALPLEQIAYLRSLIDPTITALFRANLQLRTTDSGVLQCAYCLDPDDYEWYIANLNAMKLLRVLGDLLLPTGAIRRREKSNEIEKKGDDNNGDKTIL